MSEPSGWHFHVGDLINFGQKVVAYSDGLDPIGFVASGINYDATLRNLELIGEGAIRIPREVENKHPEIAWRQIIATRNRFIHGCLGIDDDMLWSILPDD